jgi:diguanylate cyclase (GGDEF)-like protein
MGKEDFSTRDITNIREALSSSEKEAETLPACLVVMGGELNGTIFDLIERDIIIGRNIDNQIPLDIKGISRKHCKITQIEGLFFLEDLGSKNGTFLNNQKLRRKTSLRKGDIIKLGKISLKFIPMGDAERLSYDKLTLDASIDKWTGAFNKVYFIKALDREFKKCLSTGDPFTLMIMDIDFFKKINDQYGHDAGDFVLKELSNILRNNFIRKSDVFARFGGEEFVIISAFATLENTLPLAERIRKRIENHEFLYNSHKILVTISIGLCDNQSGVQTPADLFKRADDAVYMAKNSGRNRVCTYNEKFTNAA